MHFAILIAIFFIGLLSSFIGSITSGGGGLFCVPALIFLGLSPNVAIATSKFGSLGWVASTVYRFSQSKKIVYRYLIPMIIVTTLGGYIGARLLININQDLILKILGTVILIMVPVILWKKDLGVKKQKPRGRKMIVFGLFIYFLLSIYDGFMGVAGGILTAYLFVLLFGFTYIEANATDKVAYAFNLILSLLIFAQNGIIDYSYGFAYLGGTIIGGYLGADTAVKKGERWVRAVFIILVVLFGLKLIFF